MTRANHCGAATRSVSPRRPRTSGGSETTRCPPAHRTRPGSATAVSSEAMTGRAQTPGELAPQAIVASVDADDHVRGGPLGPIVVVYGDYQCPYSRVAFREIERVERRTENAVRFVFRHF